MGEYFSLTPHLDFVNIPSSFSIDYFHKLVAENGGTFSMNLNDSVTHCVAADKKGSVFFFCFYLLKVEEEILPVW